MEKTERVCIVLLASPFLCDDRTFPSLGPLSVAGCLADAQVPVDVIDLSALSNPADVLARYCSTTETRIFALGCTTPQLPQARSVIATLREIRPQAKIILAGSHVTFTCSDYKREKARGKLGRAHTAFALLTRLADVLVSGDGLESIFVAIRPDSPPLVDADDPSSAMFIQPARLGEYSWPRRELIDLDSYHFTINGERGTHLVGMLGCPYQCIAEHMLIGTPSGLFYADEIERDRIDICPDGHLHTLGQFHDGEIVSNGHKETIELTLQNGLQLCVTPEHPILSAHKEQLVWKPAGSLTPGDWVALDAWANTVQAEWPLTPPVLPPKSVALLKYHVRYPATFTADSAWVAGLLIADGSLPSDGRPSTHFAVKPRVQERLLASLRACFGDIPLVLKPFLHTNKIKQIWLHSAAIRAFFEQSLGINCKDKLRVPLAVRRSPRHIVRAFLDGLFGGDGYFNGHGHPYVGTKSHRFAQELVQLALWSGWGASICYSMPDPKGHRHARVSLCTDDCWSRDYGGHPCITASVPLDNRRIYRSHKSGLLHWRTTTGHVPGALRTAVAELEPTHPLIQGHYLYSPVLHSRPSGVKPVFDVSVPERQQFAAGGIAVHNCTFCGGRMSPSFRRVRVRPLENILAEIRHLYETYHYRAYMMSDDEVNLGNFVPLMDGLSDLQEQLGETFIFRAFVKANLFSEAQAAAMRRAGLTNILIGCESGSERILTNIQKKSTRAQNTQALEIAAKHGISVKCLLSLGHAGEDERTIEETYRWVLAVQPQEFDVTILSLYPATPAYSLAVPHPTESGVYVYTAKNGTDRLYSFDVDFSVDSAFYKGVPGDYTSLVWTDALSREELVRLRNWLEEELRHKLGLPYPQVTPASRYEASMGQLPGYIYRSSHSE